MNTKIAADGYSIFGFFFMMLLFKGFLVSAAGPAPNYDMQRILSTRSPKEASLMNMWVNVVLIFPRYFMITGLTILALVFYSDTVRAMGSNIDFEMILPDALARFVPDRPAGPADRGAAGGLHVELRGHRQRRAALHRQRHLPALHQPARQREDLRAHELRRLARAW